MTLKTNDQVTYFAGTHWCVRVLSEVPSQEDIKGLLTRNSGELKGLAKLAVDSFGAPVSSASTEVKLLVNIMVNENLALSRGTMRILLEELGVADLESDHTKFFEQDKNRSGIQKQTSALKTGLSDSNRSVAHYFLMPYLAQTWSFNSGKKVFGKKLEVTSSDSEIAKFLTVSENWTKVFKDIIWRDKQVQRAPRPRFFYPDSVVPNTNDWVYSTSGDVIHPTPGFVKETFDLDRQQEVFPGLNISLKEALSLLPSSSTWSDTAPGTKLSAVKSLTNRVLAGEDVYPPKFMEWDSVLKRIDEFC